jgi:hypothetical protein
MGWLLPDCTQQFAGRKGRSRVRVWLTRGLVALAVLFIAVYVGDSVVFKLRGSPRSMVTVDRYLTIPLKGGKQEFDYQGSMDVQCTRSLFPQAGQSPCWQVRRNKSQTTSL